MVESSGAWTCTLCTSETDTDALDCGDSGTEPLSMVASDGTATDSHDGVGTVTGDDNVV